MSSSPEPRHAAAVLPALLAVLARRRRAVVLIDGRSGSGKTTFAAGLAQRSGARLLRLEDLYPGWDGLDAAARVLVDHVLVPRGAGLAARATGWDWVRGSAVPGVVVRPDAPLVVEGCGALSAAAARLADATVWVELGAEERKRRALERDGAAFAPHWERWATQEARFRARERPVLRAQVVVDGRTVEAAPAFSAGTGDAQ